MPRNYCTVTSIGLYYIGGVIDKKRKDKVQNKVQCIVDVFNS